MHTNIYCIVFIKTQELFEFNVSEKYYSEQFLLKVHFVTSGFGISHKKTKLKTTPLPSSS